jgi:hypothetical protein
MSLPTERASSVVAAVFESLGAQARFLPNGEAAFDCRAIPRSADAIALSDFFPARAEQTGRVLALRIAEVADRPKRGDAIEILPGGMAQAGVYPVSEEAVSTDRFGLIWLAPVGEPL